MSSAAPKSVSQRTGSSASSVRSPPGPSTAKPWFWLVISIAPGGQVLDGVVGAAVAEGQLEGLQAHRAAQQLVAEADAEHRQLADQLAHGVDDVVERRRVAGAVGQEDGVGPVGEQVLGAGRARVKLDPRAARAQVGDDRVLDAGVDDAIRGPRPRRSRASARASPAPRA